MVKNGRSVFVCVFFFNEDDTGVKMCKCMKVKQKYKKSGRYDINAWLFTFTPVTFTPPNIDSTKICNTLSILLYKVFMTF